MVERSDSGEPSRIESESAGSSKGRSRKSGPKRPPSLREELERAAAGLSHMSESDYPFQFFTLPAESENDLTPEGFLYRLGVSQQFIDEFNVPTDKLIEEWTLDDFFPNQDDLSERHGTDADDPQVVSEWERIQRLKEVLERRLRGVKVFRVGQVEIRCYIAGLDEQGNIAGLVTTAIET
jgi:hypothetical protein